MLFIAEIGLNHNGNLGVCYEMIKKAKQAGADIAKFQLGWRNSPGEINCIDDDWLKKLKEWCDYFEIEFMASLITEEAFRMVKEISPRRYKIASRTLKDNFSLAEAIVREGRETIVSLGMWDKKELPFKASNVKYLWCKSKYPCYTKDLVDLPKDFNTTPYWGYSDHYIGIETALLAISRGVSIPVGLVPEFPLPLSFLTPHTTKAIITPQNNSINMPPNAIHQPIPSCIYHIIILPVLLIPRHK